MARPAAGTGWDVAGVCLAAAAFAVLCVLVLRAVPYLPEPDDSAYRAWIVAMTDGHFFTRQGRRRTRSPCSWHLSSAAAGWVRVRGSGPVQSVRLPGGRWISERIRATRAWPWRPGARPHPAGAAVYGALACLGLYAGGRRWLGGFGGAAAVGLYCSCGAAILFAWRDYMPTFTEASLIAAGTGALLWAVLAAKASTRRRTWAGLAGFVALEAATFSRYTTPRRPRRWKVPQILSSARPGTLLRNGQLACSVTGMLIVGVTGS